MISDNKYLIRWRVGFQNDSPWILRFPLLLMVKNLWWLEGHRFNAVLTYCNRFLTSKKLWRRYLAWYIYKSGVKFGKISGQQQGFKIGRVPYLGHQRFITFITYSGRFLRYRETLATVPNMIWLSGTTGFKVLVPVAGSENGMWPMARKPVGVGLPDPSSPHIIWTFRSF